MIAFSYFILGDGNTYFLVQILQNFAAILCASFRTIGLPKAIPKHWYGNHWDPVKGCR